MGVQITIVRKEDVPSVWGRARPVLEKTVVGADGRHDIYSIGNEVHSGNQDLWVVFDEETDELLTSFTTKVNRYPLRKILTVMSCSSDGISRFREAVLNSLDEFAVQGGCSGVEFLDANGLSETLGMSSGFSHSSTLRRDFEPARISKNVRLATPMDAQAFTVMWKKYMVEMSAEYKDSFEIKNTDATEYTATRLFSSYVNGGEFLGRCFLWLEEGDPSGFALVGAVPGEKTYDVVWSRPAWLTALYLSPESRGKNAYREMYEVGKDLMRELGFSDILGSVSAGNKVSYKIQKNMGARPYGLLMQCPLED